MKVNFATNSSSVKPNFTAKSQRYILEEQVDTFETNNKKRTFKEKVGDFFKKFKTAIVATATAATTALSMFLVFNQKNKELKEQKEKLQQQIDNIVLPDDVDKIVDEKINELDNKNLAYDPTEPPQKEKKSHRKSLSGDLIELPKEHKKSTLRKDAKELNYPEFNKNEAYEFEFPASKDITIIKDDAPITPIGRTLTTVSESYADSLVWDYDKVARDLLQNFYDGHGQTLDGVKFEVKPKEDGRYTVRISGKSTYSPDKAILLGESSKKDNVNAAGNYGEGLKMVVLKLLKENGADEVNIAANNWKVNWKFEENEFNKNVLAYKLDEINPIDGNYIEFDTNNEEFIQSMINTFDRFYHYNNMAFSCPDFENDKMGIKLIDKEKNGKVYIAGQAFEVDGNYQAIKGMNIYLKEKPPLEFHGEKIFDPSRDRTSLTSDNLKTLGKWVASKENMSKDEAVNLIHSLEQYWDMGTTKAMFKHNTKGAAFICGLYSGLADRYDLNIKFPEKCVADSWGVSDELKQMYIDAGYKICNSNFGYMGMTSIAELVEKTRQHQPIEPNNAEKNKILILQEAIELLAPYLKEDKLFDNEELKTKIYIYDRKSNNEDKAYDNVQGEAIIKSGSSSGFWIDKTYLNQESFSALLGTSLHELTHKFGGDESSRFSYKLTDVMQKVFKAINENPNLAIQMKVLEKAWNAQEENK